MGDRDRGLQPERTELAWRRTALSAGVLSLISARVLPVALGHPGWALLGAVGLLGAGAVWLASQRRFRQAPGDPRPGVPMPSGGAGLLLCTAIGFTLLGIGGAAVLVHTIR